MRALVLGGLLAATGCDRAFGVTHLDAPPPPPCFGDDFDDNAIDPARWVVSDPASPNVIAERDMTLTIALAPSPDGAYQGNTLVSAATHDLTDGEVVVEVERVVSFAGGGENYLALVVPGTSDGYLISVGGQGTINLNMRAGGVNHPAPRAYYTAEDRFWRFRHDGARGVVVMETSATRDFATAVRAHEVEPLLPLDALLVVFGAGTFQGGNNNPGAAIYDDVRLTTPRCTPPAS